MSPSAAIMSPPASVVAATSDTQAFTIPNPVTIEGLGARRLQAGRLVAGVAATSDVELFKGRTQHLHKQKAKRWDHRLNRESLRLPSSIKGAAVHLSKPGIISLGGGLPSSEYFPFSSFSYRVPRLGHFSESETTADGVDIYAGKHDLVAGNSIFDISTSLNYGQGSGSAQLLRFVIEHTELVHNPPYADWSCTMTIGSTSGLDMLFRMFVPPTAAHGAGGPPMCILSEEYTFSTAVEAAKPMGIHVTPVPVDAEGLRADSLDEILSNWDPAQHDGAAKPFLLYTVPTGQNPTGSTQSLPRRKAVYALAQKHDILIVEDEPYYFLQMQPYTGPDMPIPAAPKSHAEFLESLVPSFLSMDTDGRVFRLDSFSKVIAPGSRLGWLTAPAQITERYKTHADTSTQGASGFSQLALFKLLDEHWGHAGYLDWLLHIRMSYTARRDVILRGSDAHLPRQVCNWAPPMAGMFFWVEVLWRSHPLASKVVLDRDPEPAPADLPLAQRSEISLQELEDKIWLHAIDNGCLLIRGSWFAADSTQRQERMFFRATYAAALADQIEEACRRFGVTLREEFDLPAEGVKSGHEANGVSEVKTANGVNKMNDVNGVKEVHGINGINKVNGVKRANGPKRVNELERKASDDFLAMTNGR